MAATNTNNTYLSINGFEVGGIYRSATFSRAVGEEDTTAGSGTNWSSSAPKLENLTGTITVICDSVAAATHIQSMLPASNIGPVVYGPMGNTSGQLRHDQDFLITGVNGPSTNVDKTLVVLEISVKSVGAPRANMYAGDTWA